MSRTRPVLTRLSALGVALVLFAGCTTSSPPASTSSPPPTVSPVCAAADAYGDALTGFKDALKPGTTVEQVRAARDQVVKAHDDLVTTTGSVAKERMDAVKSAEDKFAAAVTNVSNAATLTEAVDSLRDEAANVQAALSDLATEVRC